MVHAGEVCFLPPVLCRQVVMWLLVLTPPPALPRLTFLNPVTCACFCLILPLALMLQMLLPPSTFRKEESICRRRSQFLWRPRQNAWAACHI